MDVLMNNTTKQTRYDRQVWRKIKTYCICFFVALLLLIVEPWLIQTLSHVFPRMIKAVRTLLTSSKRTAANQWELSLSSLRKERPSVIQICLRKSRQVSTRLIKIFSYVQLLESCIWAAGAFKELNTSEVWFDAEEDFHPAAPAAEMREQSTGKAYHSVDVAKP